MDLQPSLRKVGAEINNRKFLSRVIYRMPNGMHIRGRRKRGSSRVPDGTTHVHQLEEKDSQAAPVSVNENSLLTESHQSDAEGKRTDPKTVNSNKRVTRQTRSSRNTSQVLALSLC